MKDLKRAYVARDLDARIEKFAHKNNMDKQQAYNNLLINCVDENGNAAGMLVLTEEQRVGVDVISKCINQTPEKTAQDLINCALLFFGTDITLRDVLVYNLPLLKARLKDINPELTKEMFRDIK